MNILVLDTSSVVATVGICNDEKLIGEYTINHKKTHSEKLLPMVDEVLNAAGLKPKDIDVFGVSLGPGSFTGLRIGITTIKVMAQAMAKPVVGISALEALAYNAPFYEGTICPMIDGQRDLVYTASYKWEDNELVQVEEQQVLDINDVLKHYEKETGNVLFIGDGAVKHKSKIEEQLTDKGQLPPASLIMPRAASLCEAAKKKVDLGQLQNPKDLLPTYMRKSQAERQYDEKVNGCGIK
ncbi:tRNA (adenosine(37)-N6)-threonylcarbamoyltransferase complex dimerization subunit type 1 TsaB [Serpentinicella sp. ANB-PHB4]|uniref:tRNA (adenosine(37)-N6)-threonylcarbamoyltransferase complex dimerization subunit type 1 TsaB n=1 Tax=Serpentinicella sp. ANB-PHB4 TaxID=3074076 RepID=UPI0028604BD6|nr:tRNA (adenosine(37)-N6)-threonylcarbamoyltransferase complex dimerization subunit type 1 TsaB [Serpentinicella sp. ANB-PHB4]MDR5659809.1 tRNA (adenosine(37)-N6)-threonylcarbamoyltransferase complex dimerization subunit type 1 TsaB [Serpentinicella sp. ANB-PHB4]